MATLTQKEAERLDRLRARVEWLESKMARLGDRGKWGYELAEASALRWAIEFIETTEDVEEEA